jgi:thiamine pyrophosphate-dependent acetolactate synthase large subunit-like protein
MREAQRAPTDGRSVAAAVPQPTVADVVGETIGSLGVHDVFGVLGSGNLIVTNAVTRTGALFHHTRHESGAIGAADGYSRVCGRVGVASVHQGPGLTNTMTALTEAAKSRTSLLVLAGETPAAALTSNFRIDQHDLVESVGAIAERVHGPETAADDALRAYERARTERRPVVLMLPIDIQAKPPMQTAPSRAGMPPLPPPTPPYEAITQAVDLLETAERPAIIAGRGAVLANAGPALEELGQRIGAILATSAPANGLFAGLPYALGISGGFASPLAQELLPQADVVLIVGASANQWTTRHGKLIADDAWVIRVDTDPAAIGRNRPADRALIGDALTAAAALTVEVAARNHHNSGFRTPALAEQIAARRWQAEAYEDASTDEYIDPRTLSVALNRLLPANRAVVVDSGHFMGYPSMYLDVADAHSWVFVNGFQAVGLGIGAGLGASIANPDRPTVVTVGDGGAFMALQELETAARLKLMLLVVIYDDAAYGAEVHHFQPMGHDVTCVRFPDVDLAEIARAAGAKAGTVRSTDDLQVVEEWLVNPHGPLVLDAKVNPTICAEWLAEAFRGG